MKKITIFLFNLLIASSLILSACASTGTSEGLAGTSWKLVSYGPTQNQTAAAPGIQTNLDFGTDGTVNGNVGCNSFSGNFQVNNGNVTFSRMLSTMMACQEPRMTQERVTLQVMSGTVHFQLQGNTLTIYDASGSNIIKLSK